MSLDRLERRLPEVLTELSLPSVPDYVDNLLSRTERTPQRPGWTFLERWLPVSTFTASLSRGGRLSLRPLIAVAILIAIVIASIVLYVGSQHRVPPLFGPARNGVLITADAAGSIVTVDPVSGATRTLVNGPNLCCAGFSPDGQRITYLHLPPGGGDAIKATIANLDGSTLRDLSGEAVAGLDWGDWTPSGDRLLLTVASGALIVDVATGKTTTLASLPFGIARASWIGTTGDVLLTSKISDTLLRLYRLRAGKTDGAEQIAQLPYAVNLPLVSPDGSRLIYFTWGPEPRLQGDIHVFDLASRIDSAITEEAFDDSQAWENPVWSPDGSRVAVELYTAGPNHIAVLPATGGPPVLLGREFATSSGGAVIRFSPDGESLLVTYRDNGTTWLLPVAGGTGQQVTWAQAEDIEWQRLAP
jgi:hypothetical protein